MRIAFLTFALLLACGPIPPVMFTTPCGMNVLGTGYEPDPYDIANLERTAVAYGLVTCGKLRGWQLLTQSDAAWYSPRHGIRIAGVTYCRSRTVEIGNSVDSLDFKKSAYAHELVHVGECPWENVNHDGWSEPDAFGTTTYKRIEAVRR